MTRLALIVVVLTALLGCGNLEDQDLLDLNGEWVRIGFPDCEGTIPLQELPIERDFIQSNRLTIEHDADDRLIFRIDGRFLIEGRLDGHDIILGEGAAYGIAIDADPPLRYAEISVQREAFLLDDGDVLVIRDEFLSYGDDLTCWHEWERG